MFNMSYHIFGYNWCHYYQSACTYFERVNVPYVKHAFDEREKFSEAVSSVCTYGVIGTVGTTSPQIFKIIPNEIRCLGGYDQLKQVKNLKIWPKQLIF